MPRDLSVGDLDANRTTSEYSIDVTIVVTCYNHQAYVEQCLASLTSAATRPRQIVIIDDCSTDDSVAVIRHWLDSHQMKATFIARTTNGGVCAALNDALAQAEGTYLRHVSADDWLEPDELRGHVDALAGCDESIAFAVGNILETDAGGLTLAAHDLHSRLDGLTGIENREELHHELLKRNLVPAPGVVTRTAAVRAVGGYDTSLVFEDYDMWLRLSAQFGAIHHPRTVASYRILPTSLTRAAGPSARFLTSEIHALRKHSGQSAEADSIIESRVAEIQLSLARVNQHTHSAQRSPRGTRRKASETRST